jgi:DNA-binding CsgD family transcriptional regulator
MTIPESELSEREREILRFVATGASNKEIARHFSISVNTVKVHLRNIFAKIGVSSRTEAAMYAVNAGLVEKSGEQPQTSGDLNMQGDQSMSQSGVLASKNISRYTWSTYVILSAVILVLLAFAGYLMVVRLRMPNEQTLSEQTTGGGDTGWKSLAPMPTARYGLAVVSYENYIYAIGGNTGKIITSTVERYDSGTDSWDSMSPKPARVSDIQAAVIGGKIYVPGGLLESGEVSNQLEVYDPSNDVWHESAPLPIPLSAYALAAYEGRLYLFGGWDGKQYVDIVSIYNPITDMWEYKDSFPLTAGYSGAAIAGEKIFIMGGFDGKKLYDTNLNYNPNLDLDDKNPWFLNTTLPEARYGMGVVGIANIVEVLGGIAENNNPPMSLSFFPLEEKWREFGGLKENNPAFPGVTTLGVFLHVIGGSINGLPTNQHLAYQAIYTTSFPIIQNK